MLGLARSAQLACLLSFAHSLPLPAFARPSARAYPLEVRASPDEDDQQADEHHDDRQHHGMGIRDKINHGRQFDGHSLTQTLCARVWTRPVCGPRPFAGGGAQVGSVCDCLVLRALRESVSWMRPAGSGCRAGQEASVTMGFPPIAREVPARSVLLPKPRPPVADGEHPGDRRRRPRRRMSDPNGIPLEGLPQVAAAQYALPGATAWLSSAALLSPSAPSQPAAETALRLVPRGIVHRAAWLMSVRKLHASPSQPSAKLRPCQHRRAHQIPCRELHVPDAWIIIQKRWMRQHISTSIVGTCQRSCPGPRGRSTHSDGNTLRRVVSKFAMVAAQEPIGA